MSVYELNMIEDYTQYPSDDRWVNSVLYSTDEKAHVAGKKWLAEDYPAGVDREYIVVEKEVL